MKDNIGREIDPMYLNEFIDYEPKPIRLKKSVQKEKIKIMSKKLPFDFFRPHTREFYNQENRSKDNETPVFGQQRQQSNSITLITKNKIYPDPDSFINRADTMPVDPPSEPSQIVKKQQYSYRLHKDAKIGHKSTQRQLKKYKKKLTEESGHLEQNEKSGKRRIYEQRIKLNINKFFKADSLESNQRRYNQFSKKEFSNKNISHKLPPIM